MKKSRLLGAVCACLTVVSFNANAVAFDFNYSSTSTLFTANDGTQTEWMHFDQTEGMTHSYVEELMGAGGIFEGYSFATRADVYDLTSQLFGRAWTTSPASEENVEYYNELGSFFGFHSGPDLEHIWAVTGDTRVIYDDITQLLGFQAVSYGTDYPTDLANTALFTSNVVFNYDIYSRENSSIRLSHIIYKDVSSVPAPMVFELMSIGLVAVGVATKRRKKLS